MAPRRMAFANLHSTTSITSKIEKKIMREGTTTKREASGCTPSTYQHHLCPPRLPWRPSTTSRSPVDTVPVPRVSVAAAPPPPRWPPAPSLLWMRRYIPPPSPLPRWRRHKRRGRHVTPRRCRRARAGMSPWGKLPVWEGCGWCHKELPCLEVGSGMRVYSGVIRAAGQLGLIILWNF